jgi:signal transduction histidine kinase
MLIATFQSIYSYVPSMLTPPRIEIVEIVADSIYQSPRQVTFPDSTSLVLIRYRGKSWCTSRIRYSCILEGHDSSWHDTWDTEISYRNLPASSYTFRVIAINRDLVPSAQPASVSIVIEPDPRERVISEIELRVNERTSALEEANRNLSNVNKELDDFAYAVSHDLKAQLRAITSLATWITERLGEEGKKQLNLLCQRTDKMRGLIDGVLRYSRLGRTAMELQTVDMNAVLAEVLHMLAPPAHVSVKKTVSLPAIVTDRVRMHEVLQNLISNAVKYNDKAECHITIDCNATCDNVTISVADNGPGIDPRHHERIFKLFETLGNTQDSDSTGVGLALVKKIVSMLGGTVGVRSSAGEGSTFYFTLPMGGPDAHRKTDSAG